MDPRDPKAESTERNAPSVEAAFQAVPPEQVAEIVAGELYVSPRPAQPHTRVASQLGVLLGGPFWLGRGGPGGWVILDEPELDLGPRPDKLVPDLAGWRRERMPHSLEGEGAPSHYALAPDWVCEVLSARTQRVDKGPKMRIYGRDGVRHVWHVDPLAHTLDIFRREGGHWLLVESFSTEERVRAEPFDAVDLELALLWAG
ncbi:Uma2 family endonuclease [Archangium primigenium]|uniref:Uma2 family endonuclease n=1 Tax=[Archangium] primigenium TaxID=2792470 RepID=UPI001959D9DD|nr:Uma2 family endonuclease [Archangium primigenium]MBM7117297.1 Uma2 family endonuclease [Archangium primigenium]